VNAYGYPGPSTSSAAGYRSATPNSRGQYSDATLNELESQNDGQVEGILGKVKQLKDVGLPHSYLFVIC
jgi:blocked-early-in-transport protein 1